MNELKKQANLFDMPIKTAIIIKLRSITYKLLANEESSLEYAMALADFYDCVEELLTINKRETFVNNNNYRESVTQEMREQALAYPIQRLLGQHNVVKAWCHNDKRPSLSINTVKNKAFCNPCNKAFNPIDVVMHQEGLKYYEAIRRLCES